MKYLFSKYWDVRPLKGFLCVWNPAWISNNTPSRACGFSGRLFNFDKVKLWRWSTISVVMSLEFYTTRSAFCIVIDPLALNMYTINTAGTRLLSTCQFQWVVWGFLQNSFGLNFYIDRRISEISVFICTPYRTLGEYLWSKGEEDAL